jgi:hypothetical protein
VKKRFLKFASISAFAVTMIFPLASVTAADKDWSNACHERLEHDKAHIDHDAARYGEHSRKVDRDVDKLEADRQWCRSHHADWDHSQFDVGIYLRH